MKTLEEIHLSMITEVKDILKSSNNPQDQEFIDNAILQYLDTYPVEILEHFLFKAYQ
jgi:hypothetical protein